MPNPKSRYIERVELNAFLNSVVERERGSRKVEGGIILRGGSRWTAVHCDCESREVCLGWKLECNDHRDREGQYG